MREILFRGKRVDNGEWVEGYLIHIRDYCCILTLDCEEYGSTYLDPSFGYIDGAAIPVIPETVGQYIGKEDLFGIKVFEGDILCERNSLSEHYYLIEYEDSSFGYKHRGISDKLSYHVDQSKYCIPIDDCESNISVENCEIVGNIHDNPEIWENLKKKN